MRRPPPVGISSGGLVRITRQGSALPILRRMRLSPSERRAIELTAREAFPSGTRVVLFGSRVDDARRGGDIDLLIEPATVLPADELVARRSRFVSRLYALLDEQRIDVLVACETLDDPRPVVKAARLHGMELSRT